MSSRMIVGGFVSLFVLVGCSGSSGSAIPAPVQTGEIGSVGESPTGSADPPLNKRSASADAGTAEQDAGDADAGESDAGREPSTCETCSTTSCAAERKACEEDATCPMLKQCLDTCATSACRSDCFLEFPEPEAKTKNGALWKCECMTTCATACKVECN